MKYINAAKTDHHALNEAIRKAGNDCKIIGCLGQRFLCAGMTGGNIIISGGIPGNALGAYLNGGKIIVNSNAQDAVGDTMNAGEIIIHGNVGDAVGYAMRGGKIFVKGDAGYRAGIHMKAYKEKIPVLVIGGKAGSFLGEYQAGGVIVVLGLTQNDRRIVGNFPGTGMHGGKMILRSDCRDIAFPGQVTARAATPEDREEIGSYVAEYCALFGGSAEEILNAPFTVVAPDSKNPYRQLYVAN